MLSSQNRRQQKRRHVISEINVTPFVDVVLVLLIVFMVTAPLVTSGIRVDLPTGTRKSLGGDNKPIIVSIAEDGKIYVQDQKRATPERQLVAKIDALVSGNREDRVFLRADHRLQYANVMKVMGLLANAGFSRVGLVSDPESNVLSHAESDEDKISDRQDISAIDISSPQISGHEVV